MPSSPATRACAFFLSVQDIRLDAQSTTLGMPGLLPASLGAVYGTRGGAKWRERPSAGTEELSTGRSGLSRRGRPTGAGGNLGTTVTARHRGPIETYTPMI